MDEIETGRCACGAETDYYGPDPYASEMCDSYRAVYHPDRCVGECGCYDQRWMCDGCYDESVACI